MDFIPFEFVTAVQQAAPEIIREDGGAMGIAMSIFSLLGTFIIGFSMLPQTIATWKSRQTAGLNLLLYFLMGIATFLITLYGIALCIVPTNPTTDYINSFPPETTVIKYPTSGSIIAGYIVPGAAIIFGELLCTITSFIIAGIKIQNMMGAKKAGISEQQYIDKMLRAKGVKVQGA